MIISTSPILTTDLPGDAIEMGNMLFGDIRPAAYRVFVTTGEGNHSFNLVTSSGTVFLRVTDLTEVQLDALMVIYRGGYFCSFDSDRELKAKVENCFKVNV